MPPEAPTEEVKSPSAQADTTNQVEAQDVEQAAPSAADDKGDKSPATLFDAIKVAMNPEPAEASPASEGQDEEGSKPEADKPEAKAEGEADDEEELSEDELARLSKKTRKSVRRLLTDRANLRAEVDELRPAAERFQEMRRFTDDAGLVSQEITAGFNIMRLMKHEPDKALEMLAPYVQQLMQVTGRLLPKDLQEQVRTGQISPEAAQELSRTRARVAFTEQRETQRQTTQVQQTQAAAQTQTIGLMVNAVTALEQTWLTSDPDYAVKSTRVQEKLKLAVHEGRIPQTPEQATQLVKECKAEVDKELKRHHQQRRQPMVPVTGNSSPSAAPKPSSTLDAIRRVVAA